VHDLVVPLAVLGATALFVVLAGLVALVVRRVLLRRGVGTFECSLRQESPQDGAGGWRLGVGRYERDRLDWFRLVTVSPRPARSLARGRLAILGRRAPERPELRSLAPGWVVVRCAYGALTVEFAMSEPAANGLATWLESGPPGQYADLP
jgi:hypothetical protein